MSSTHGEADGRTTTIVAAQPGVIRDERPIVCFSSNDWHDIASSKLHIMRHLGRTRTILFVETIGIRHPQASARDVRRAFEKLRLSRGGLRQVDDRVYAWSPLVIPYHGVRGVATFNKATLTRSLRRHVLDLGLRDPLVWTYLPNTIDVIERLCARHVIYHCIDDYGEFTDAPRESFDRMETRLLSCADLTVVSSNRLLELKRDRARWISYVPHGVDAEFFTSRIASDGIPADIRGIRQPIAGFVGRIADWIDLGLIEATARLLPGWSFVLVGPSNIDTSQLQRLENVHILGRREYNEIPSYMAHFDVGLMPFTQSKVVDSVNPLKFYEYLAAGKPVVSSPMAEVSRYPSSLVAIGAGDGFARAIVDAHAQDSPARAAERLAYAGKRSWAAIAETILDQFYEATARSGAQ